MDKTVPLNIRLTPTLKKVIQEYITLGTYQDISEFARDAMREKIQRDAPNLYSKLFLDKNEVAQESASNTEEFTLEKPTTTQEVTDLPNVTTKSSDKEVVDVLDLPDITTKSDDKKKTAELQPKVRSYDLTVAKEAVGEIMDLLVKNKLKPTMNMMNHEFHVSFAHTSIKELGFLKQKESGEIKSLTVQEMKTEK